MCVLYSQVLLGVVRRRDTQVGHLLQSKVWQQMKRRQQNCGRKVRFFWPRKLSRVQSNQVLPRVLCHTSGFWYRGDLQPPPPDRRHLGPLPFGPQQTNFGDLGVCVCMYVCVCLVFFVSLHLAADGSRKWTETKSSRYDCAATKAPTGPLGHTVHWKRLRLG